jgi:hypothetical protein
VLSTLRFLASIIWRKFTNFSNFTFINESEIFNRLSTIFRKPVNLEDKNSSYHLEGKEM